MLLGTVGVLDTNTAPYQPSTHALIEQQCAYCHMQTAPETEGPSEPEGEMAAVTGHSFAMASYEACTKCHGSNTNTIAFFVKTIQTTTVSNPDFGIDAVKNLLDLWGTSVAPEMLRTNYGALSWEYTSPGDLEPSGSSGPTTAEQALIPDDIKKARFNLYLVLYDGSLGVHNGPYALALLQTARDLVEAQLYQ